MANLTYAGPVYPMIGAFDALRRTGGLKPGELPPSPVLTSTRDAIFGLWQRWDDAKANAIAANNLFLDTPVPQRKADIERLKARVGACRDTTAVEPENLLRGKFRINCERGTVRATFTLAPTQPPTVQYLRFEENPPGDNNVCRP
jgi:hypothetical protein